MTSGRKVVLAVGAGLAIIVVLAAVLAVTAGAPRLEPPEPTPQSARTDCPSGWKPIYDFAARFSMCRPLDWQTHAQGDDLSVMMPGSGQTGAIVSWVEGSGLQPPCGGGVPLPDVKTNRTSMKIGGQDRDVCLTDKFAKAGDATPVQSSIIYRLPVTSGGVLTVTGTFTEQSQRGLILQLLDTIRAT